MLTVAAVDTFLRPVVPPGCSPVVTQLSVDAVLPQMEAIMAL